MNVPQYQSSEVLDGTARQRGALALHNPLPCRLNDSAGNRALAAVNTFPFFFFFFQFRGFRDALTISLSPVDVRLNSLYFFKALICIHLNF